MNPETTNLRCYTVAEFDADPDAGCPPCSICYATLGVRRAIFSPTGRDEWWCDNCGRCVVYREVERVL